MAQQLKIDIVAKDKSKQALTGVRGGLDRLKKSVFSLQSAFIGLGAGLAIKSLVNTGKQIEGLQVRLKFLFGTASEGAKAFDEMAKFAAKVPFSLEEIQSGSGVLAVVSKDAKELANLMEITGNVAAVTGLDFKTTSEQIQRSMSAGISAADLFRDRGVKSMLGFKAGAVVTVEETAAAFTKIFGKGGKFGGATDELAKTFEGTLSMIGDKFFNFKRSILEAGFFDGLKSEFGDLNIFLENNAKKIDQIAKKIGKGLAEAVITASKAIKILNDNFKEIEATLGILLVALGGTVKVIIGIAAIIDSGNRAFDKFRKIATDVKSPFDDIRNASKDIVESQKEMTKELESSLQKIEEFESEMSIAIPSATQKAINKFKELNDEALQNMKLTMEDIKILLIEGVHGAVKKISMSLAESVVHGKNLVESFKAMAQGVMVKIIAHLIEQVALMGIQKLFKLDELNNEAKKDNLIRKQNTNLKRQIVYQSILAALGGGGSFLSTSGGSMSGKASGGAVAKGQPYMVGENGAEMFVPNQSGQIQQTARGGSGGGSTTVNFNINTVDARGFDELLTQSRGTITQLINQAVNERGAKSII